jgi:hypothetical protein
VSNANEVERSFAALSRDELLPKEIPRLRFAPLGMTELHRKLE